MNSIAIIPGVINVYKSWNRMLGIMGKHVAKNGFYLVWYDKSDTLGFQCGKTGEAWVMAREEILAESLVAKAWSSAPSQKKFLDSLNILLGNVVSKEEERAKCKTTDCERPATKSEFCGWCINKMKKGLLSEKGIKIKTLDELKTDLTKKLTSDSLKLYQDAYPESKKSFGCPKLNIFIEPASCFHRMLVKDKKECRGCKIHATGLLSLEKFIDNGNKVPEIEA